MNELITLQEAAISLAGAAATDEQVAHFVEVLAERQADLLAVKTVSIHTAALPGGVSYLARPEQWRIPAARFEAWATANGFHLQRGPVTHKTELSPHPSMNANREKAAAKWDRLLREILAELGIDPSKIKMHKGGAQKCEEKQRALGVALEPKYAAQGMTRRSFRGAWERLPKAD